MRDTITRTFNKNNCTCLVYINGKVETVNVFVPFGYNNTVTAERYIRNKDIILSGKLIEVVSVEKVSALYGMSERDFMAHATIVEERSKDTRNMISKTVQGKVGTLVYMNEDYTTGKMAVLVDKKKKIRDQAVALAPVGKKGITIEDIHETEALYVMSEDDFIKYARPMIDYQHYAPIE